MTFDVVSPDVAEVTEEVDDSLFHATFWINRGEYVNRCPTQSYFAILLLLRVVSGSLPRSIVFRSSLLAVTFLISIAEIAAI
jgi:hypothetical protein